MYPLWPIGAFYLSVPELFIGSPIARKYSSLNRTFRSASSWLNFLVQAGKKTLQYFTSAMVFHVPRVATSIQNTTFYDVGN